MEKVTSSVGARIAALNKPGARGVGPRYDRRKPDVGLGNLTCTKVHAENRTPVWREGILWVRSYRHRSYRQKGFGMDLGDVA